MMAGNPNWWSMDGGMHPQFSQLLYASNSSLSSNSSESDHLQHHQTHDQDHFPVRSWSQLLMGGLSGNEEDNRFGGGNFQQEKSKLDNINYWEGQEQQVLNMNPINFSRDSSCVVDDDHVKQEVAQTSTCQLFSGAHLEDYHHHFHPPNIILHTSSINNSWPPHQPMPPPVSSPTSCVTNLSNSFLNFSAGGDGTAAAPGPVFQRKNHRHNQDHSSHECNSTGTGGASKKPRVQQSSSSSQPTLKVRKEKLSERVAALHQLVSPFGKTDTATVLSEAIGYIRFLQAQIEALSSPYMRNVSGNASQTELQGRGGVKDLRSRGLCLVPISCTQHVGNDNGADYWAPPALGGGF